MAVLVSAAVRRISLRGVLLPSIGGLGDEKDGAAIIGGLSLEHAEGVGEAVEDGSARVAGIWVIDGAGPLGDVGGEG